MLIECSPNAKELIDVTYPIAAPHTRSYCSDPGTVCPGRGIRFSAVGSDIR